MNKNFITNAAGVVVVALGLVLSNEIILHVGLYALSGSVTNWLAIHMLFERVPLLYGSGVIPNRFQAIKKALHDLIMDQFFNRNNIERFFANGEPTHALLNDQQLQTIIGAVDYDKIYQGLIDAVMNSSLGSMINMIGGPEVFANFKDEFIGKLQHTLHALPDDEAVQQALTGANLLDVSAVTEKLEQMVQHRVDELTPALVKEIISKMISEHLGWLVVWGGVFGGVIGLFAGLLTV